MSKSCITGVIVALLTIVQGLAHAQTTAPTTQPGREKFVYRASLIDPNRFATLINLLIFSSEGQTVTRLGGVTALRAPASAGRLGKATTTPAAADESRGSWRTQFTFTVDPADHSMLVSTLPERWPDIKRLLDRLQEAMAAISITATIIELPNDDAAAYASAIRALEIQPTPASIQRARDADFIATANAHDPVRVIEAKNAAAANQELTGPQATATARVVREANGIGTVIADGDATKILKTVDAPGRLKSAGTCNATTQADILSMLALTGDGAAMFSSDQAAKASRRADVELLVHFKPVATVDGAVVIDLATVVRQRGDAKPTTTPGADADDRSTLTRLSMEPGQSIVLFGPALRRTDPAHTPVMIFLSVSLAKNLP